MTIIYCDFVIDIIEEVLLKSDALYDNARIIANLMEFDEEVRVILSILCSPPAHLMWHRYFDRLYF